MISRKLAGEGRLLFLLVVGVLCYCAIFGVVRRPRRAEQKESPLLALRHPSSRHFKVTKDTLQKGESLYLSLKAQGLSNRQILELTKALQKVVNASKVEPGDHYVMARDSAGIVQYLEYMPCPEHSFVLERTEYGLQVRKHTVSLDRVVRGLHGQIQDCFHNAVLNLGERPQLTWAFVDIMGWDIDFNTDPREGDTFTALFEEYQNSGAPVKYGRILAAEYLARRDTVVAIYYETAEGHSDYYHPSGRSVRKTFLKAPLEFKRVSSRYSRSRLHPILKIRCPHRGVDYAAPMGTRVQATGDGVVTYAGRKGAYGRLVEIKHKHGYVTRYGHLSRYARGIKRGTQVRQKDLIGYVGSSGRSTGPHLHYELRHNGRPINPLKVNFPAADPVPQSCRVDFERVRDERLQALSSLRLTGEHIAEAADHRD